MKNDKPTEQAYAELQVAYDFYNNALFGGSLPSCLITFQRQKNTFGYYSKKRFGTRDGRTTDEIAINPEYFAVVPLIEVLQTLVHEMTHLWQDNFGKPSRACYHNAQWADKMEEIGLMPSHNGQPGGKRVGQSMADYMIAEGPFAQATRRLLTDGFAISWIDRFPASPPPRPTYRPPAAAHHANYGAAEASVSASSDVEQECETDKEDDAAIDAAWQPPSSANPDLIEGQKTGNRSNRSKYTCPGCALNVWGKPGLRVMCVDCSKPLVAAAD